jgi:AhpD family alkylhydroperoxidase
MALDNRIRELIAVGASITANCQPCLEYHVSKALEAGVDQPELGEAIELGKMVRRGAASKMDKFASTLLHAATPTAAPSNGGCGCGS